jgi:AraC-like DNA-binding protein
VELRSIQRLLDHASRGLEFSQSVSAQARPLICSMLNQTAEDRLPAVLQLLLLLSRDTGATPITSVAAVAAPSSEQTEERIGRVLAYLHRHYREETNVARLGQVAALSKSSLHRLFKLRTRMTITEYVAKLRIGNACALLLNTQRPISLIADDVGFQNLAHFNRQFKFWKQQTPRQFRRSFQH